MKYEGFTGKARGDGALTNLVNDLSADGFRIISVMDMNAPKYEGDVYLVVAQKDVDAQIHIAGGPSEDIRFGTNGR